MTEEAKAEIVHEEPEEGSAELVPGKRRPLTLAQRQQAELARLEASMFEKSMSVTESMLEAVDVDPEDPEGSLARFILQYGPDEGPRRYRVAAAAWRGPKEAPVFLKHATALAMAAAKVRANQNAAPTSLNVTFVTVAPKELRSIVKGDE